MVSAEAPATGTIRLVQFCAPSVSALLWKTRASIQVSLLIPPTHLLARLPRHYLLGCTLTILFISRLILPLSPFSAGSLRNDVKSTSWVLSSGSLVYISRGALPLTRPTFTSISRVSRLILLKVSLGRNATRLQRLRPIAPVFPSIPLSHHWIRMTRRLNFVVQRLIKALSEALGGLPPPLGWTLQRLTRFCHHIRISRLLVS